MTVQHNGLITKIRWMKDIPIEELLTEEELDRFNDAVDDILRENKWGCYAV